MVTDRSKAIRSLTLDRISAMGAMPIPIGAASLAAILADAGFPRRADSLLDAGLHMVDVEAIALECLVLTAQREIDRAVAAEAAPTVHRGELERQVGDPVKATYLRGVAARIGDRPSRLAGTNYIGWRGMVWVRCRIRKPAACWLTGADLPAGSFGWRQLSHVKGRETRVSAAAWAEFV